MSSGTSSISGASYQYGTVYCSYAASFWETNVDNNANTSKVSWSAYADYSHSHGYAFSGTTRDAAGIMRIYVNGGLAASYNVPLTSGIGNGGRLMSCSGTSSAIAHNDDGTKKVSCRVDVDSGSDPMGGGWVYSSSTGSTDSLTLTSIPRASKPTINTPNTSDNTFELGTTITIYTNRKLTGAKHTVVFKYNSTSETIEPVKAVEESVTYNTGNIAAAFLNENPNVTQLTGTIEVTTFNSSGTQVGSVQSITYTATIPDSYGPTISFPSNSIAETALNGVGVAAKTIVRYISKKKFTIKVTPKNNASTVQVILKDGSNIRYLTHSGTSTTWTGEFTGLETNNISFQATDSRGKVSSLAMTGLTLVPYIKPTIQNAYLTRVNASTGANSELTVYGAYYNGTIGSVTNKITVKYTLSGGSQQTIPANSVTYHDGVYNAVGLVGTLAPDTSYTAAVIATDSFNQPISIDISLASVHDVLWLGKKTVRVHDYLIADGDIAIEKDDYMKSIFDILGTFGGAKNLLPNSISFGTSEGTLNGLHYSLLYDGRVLTYGTTTSDANLFLGYWPWDREDTYVIFNGCINGGSSSTYYMYLHDKDDNTVVGDYLYSSTDETEILLQQGHRYGVYITVKAGVTIPQSPQQIFAPMLRHKLVHSNKYVPYSTTGIRAYYYQPNGNNSVIALVMGRLHILLGFTSGGQSINFGFSFDAIPMVIVGQTPTGDINGKPDTRVAKVTVSNMWLDTNYGSNTKYYLGYMVVGVCTASPFAKDTRLTN